MKQPYFRVIAFTLSVILFYPAFVVVSQTNNGSLLGTVTDVMGISIPRAKVSATRRADRHASFETRTDDQGKFTLANLPPGVYEVGVTSENAGATTTRIVSVQGGQAAELMIQLGAGCDNMPEGAGLVSDADKAEVIRATLKEVAAARSGLFDKKQRDSGVILSTGNISSDWLQGLQGLSMTLMTPDEIQRKADREGDFPFVSFPEVKVRSQCIAVTITNTWAVSSHSQNQYLSGGGAIYEYRKQAGKWVGRFVNGWVI